MEKLINRAAINTSWTYQISLKKTNIKNPSFYLHIWEFFLSSKVRWLLSDCAILDDTLILPDAL